MSFTPSSGAEEQDQGATPYERGAGPFRRSLKRLLRKKIAVAAIAIISALYLAGILAPLLSPYSYSATEISRSQEGPSREHWLGTDRLGRDILSRVLWGLQTTVIITLAGLLTGSLVLGVGLGLLAGYLGGRIDALIVRMGEVAAAFPDVLLIILIAATLRPRVADAVRELELSTGISGLVSSGLVDYVIVSVALLPLSWFGMMRLVRGQTLAVREAPFVEAARAVGLSTPRLLFSHVLPNVTAPIIVSASFSLGAVAGAEVFLSFLGIGVQPPRPSLGAMIADSTGRGSAVVSVLRDHPEQLLAPAAAVWLLILCWNLLGDALNDVFNPRAR